MLTVAALFRPHGLQLEDHEGYFNITEYAPGSKAVVWFLSIPKDGVSDAWRLKEAVERKTRGGKGLVNIPLIELDSLDSFTYRRYKEEFDRGFCSETTEEWGGSYVSHAVDYKNGEDFIKLDLERTPHYYNILLTVDQKQAFEAVNPGLTYVECEKMCIRETHYHGVHGLYAGAVLDPSGNEVPKDLIEDFPVLEIRHTAPPLEVIEDWLYMPAFEGTHGVPENEPEKEPGKKTKKKAKKNRTRRRKLSSCRTPGPESDGARTLRELIADPPAWGRLMEVYRNPRSARWASPGMICASGTRERALRREWNAEYHSSVLPLVQGDGIPIARLLRKIRDLDDHMWKLKASYFLRRLTAGDSGIVGYGLGKFVRMSAPDETFLHAN